MLARHRGNESITSARIVDDVAPARSAIAKRPAQRRDVDPQCPLLDDGIGPSAGDELVSGDGVASAFNQRDENVECTAAEAQRLSVFEQHPLLRDQPERAEDGLLTHRWRELDSNHRFLSKPEVFLPRYAQFIDIMHTHLGAGAMVQPFFCCAATHSNHSVEPGWGTV